MAGSGTLNDPFLVQTTADLKKVGSGTDGWGMGSSGNWIYYKQVADINWSDDSDTYFEPIGHQSGSSHGDFYGVYDGDGYKIKNLQINKSSDDYIGLFAWFAEGELKNVNLEGGNITGHNRTGSLVGLCDYNVVNNCFSSANVTGNDYTGGLIGYNYADTENCYTTGDVEGANYIGGLMGRAINCDVTKCYASGNVTANNYGAGLVGSLGSSNTTLTKSYALNTSISTSSGNTIFARVFATGSGANDNYGHEDMTVLGSTVSSSDDNMEDGADISETNAKKETTYENNGWDFVNVWTIDEGNSYPQLQIFYTTTVLTFTTSASGIGTGTSAFTLPVQIITITTSVSGIGTGVSSVYVNRLAIASMSGVGTGVSSFYTNRLAEAAALGVGTGASNIFTIKFVSFSGSGIGLGVSTVHSIKSIAGAGSGVSVSTSALVVVSFRNMELLLDIIERTVILGVNEVPIIGNTVRLTAEFKNFEGDYIDVDTPQVKIYNGKRELLETHDAVKTATGRYRYDYTIPDDNTQNLMHYEFGGTIMDEPVVGRKSFIRQWTK